MGMKRSTTQVASGSPNRESPRLTLDLYETSQRQHGNLGIALQAYLKRTPHDLQRIAPLGGHIRLCKGGFPDCHINITQL